MSPVELEHVRHVFRVDEQVVNGNHVARPPLKRVAQHQAANASEAIDSDDVNERFDRSLDSGNTECANAGAVERRVLLLLENHS